MEENYKNKNELIQSIQTNLQSLSSIELNQISYLLSLYQTPFENRDTTDIPMHFLGRFLGITQNSDGTTKMELGIQNENTYGVAQGGAIYTLCDVAIGFSILSNLKENEKVFTLELKVNFIKKGQGAYLLASPSILYQGKSTVVSECNITDENGDLVAKGLGTFYIVRDKKRGEDKV
ncbi:PaaI family thioesterase [Psychrobacillus sp. BL-248-WT-3]|uniref:PaaI family thioesterase n=1 Tax=Psychrobacillus sp. BL-248-WT-3 TaxID=2725306 RepID=UPI00146EE342|nr:PaaI family thioesterase [Psychrobacillus sp. BL-248-WT-3]NME06982.1 PaaI family thioesterase [Psychrobacillus sp. BL-248-WT-3]